MGVIDEVKQKTDIAGVVGQYVTLKKAGRNLTGLCPFHGERNPSFFVYPEQQSWHCFGCNSGGDVFSFVMKKEGADFGEALRLLAQKAGVTVPSHPREDERKEEKGRLHQVNEAAATYFHRLLLDDPAAEKARDYVKSRGFTAQTVADFQLGFSLNAWHALKEYLQERGYTEKDLLAAGLLSESEKGNTYDRFRGKLMFPIWDARGRVAGFGARALDDSLPKYINSPQTPLFDKSGLLYGFHLASPGIRRQDLAVIVEGYMDVITAHQHGFTNVVASMGTSVTETQVRALKKLSRNLVLALDADAAGEEAMLRGVVYENILENEVRVAVLPQGKDPDDVIKKDADAWRTFIAGAVPIMDYTFNVVASGLDLATARDKSLAVQRLGPVLNSMNDRVRQAHYIQKLAGLIHVGERTVEAELSRLKLPPARRAPVTLSPPRTLTSSRLEEDYLAFLLKCPEFRGTHEAEFSDYFAHSENREIFTAWQNSADPALLRQSLDPATQEHLDAIAGRSVLTDKAELRNAEYRRRLQLEYYRNLLARKSQVLALEVAEKGPGADLARLIAEGIEHDNRMKELYLEPKKKRLESRR